MSAIAQLKAATARASRGRHQTKFRQLWRIVSPSLSIGEEITQPAIEQVPPELPPGVQQNTSPNFPPVPQQPASGMGGIETATVADNV